MKLKIFLFILILLISGNVFSSINITTDTPFDVSENTFYLSKNTSKNIDFSINADLISNNLHKKRVVYDLKVYHGNLEQIDLHLSKEEEYFISSINSFLSLNVRTFEFVDQRVKVGIKVTLYDSFNNVLDVSFVYLDLVSNNSEYMFIDSPINKVPEYKGHSLSRDKLFILNKFDKDLITIKNHVDFGFAYDLRCYPNKNDIILDLRYQGDNLFNLEVSLNQDLNFFNSVYFINCYAFHQNDFHNIRPLTVNYLDYEYFLEDDFLEEEILRDNLLTRILKFFGIVK